MDTATTPRRPRGRPQARSDQETLAVIAEAARHRFVETGYSNTPMEQVAKAAGVSTKTLYRLVPTKADLFKLTISERIGRFMLALDEGLLARLPFADALERLMTKYGELVLSAEVIAVQKLVLSESDRFPELAQEFQSGAIQAMQDVIARLLRRGCAEGIIALDEPRAAAGMLRGMMALEPQRALMTGARRPPDPDEIAERARICVSLFLHGCAKGAEQR
ncbi:TetR/AcrR family transcriptional regulator [Methylobacterium nigriterrae]|uniref:TetR/AcrR family transcriptional regulator n=1 Tax=Methylobacterium nigriterrae TaxID=3127512 RepID=UPI003014085E